jgi:hypothetical protein
MYIPRPYDDPQYHLTMKKVTQNVRQKFYKKMLFILTKKGERK